MVSAVFERHADEQESILLAPRVRGRPLVDAIDRKPPGGIGRTRVPYASEGERLVLALLGFLFLLRVVRFIRLFGNANSRKSAAKPRNC